MTYAKLGQTGLDYQPCRYAGSRVMFRGPRRSLRGQYVAFFGGTDTFGRFVADPFAAHVETALQVPVVNLSAINAGLDLYIHEPSMMQIASRASTVVFQVMDAHNMSNRFYSVHPRRNDRFLRASPVLQALYPEVDFTEIHFTRHLMRKLQDLSPERFETIRTELQQAWVSRMKHLLSLVRAPVVLLWFSENQPSAVSGDTLEERPLFVTAAMLDGLDSRVATTLEVTPSRAALDTGVAGMVFSEAEVEAAGEQLNDAAHREAAEALVPLLRDLLASV